MPNPRSVNKLSLASRPVTIRAAEQGKPRTFRIEAYTGEPLNLYWPHDAPVVIDLATADISAQQIPALYDHIPSKENVVGQVNSLTIEGQNKTPPLVAEGIFTPTRSDDNSSHIVAMADAGYRWQASVGGDPKSMEKIEAGNSVEVNGRTYNGPVYVARGVVFREVSFVVLGADRRTNAVVARIKGAAMTFEEWLVKIGFSDQSTMDEVQKANLMDLYRKEYPEEDTGAESVAAEGETGAEEEDEEMSVTARNRKSKIIANNRDSIAEYRRAQAAETERVNAIRAACSSFKNPRIKVGEGVNRKDVSLEAHAIEHGWDAARTRTEAELAQLRAERPTNGVSFVLGAGSKDVNSHSVIEAAIAQSGRLQGLEKAYNTATLEAAHKTYKGRLGLQQLLLEAAYQGGYDGPINVKGNLRPVLQAAFSTHTISGILSNIANKFLLQGFMNVDSTWRLISAIRSVSDFKTVTSYRMTGAFQFDKVGSTGEIKHGTAAEESFTNQAETYAKMFSVTRKDIINDDLGALTALPQRIGRGAALKLNDVFWTAFLANSDFFKTANSNYFSGGTTNLSSASLDTAYQKFMKQVDPDGKPLGIMPAILLLPPELAVTGSQLMESQVDNSGGASTTDRIPNKNVWQGRFQNGVTPYLSNTSYTGYSTTAWYLLASPSDLATVEVAFLDGAEVPTVEESDADFNVLGIQMRGYFDFGVSLQDYRGGVKSKGAA